MSTARQPVDRSFRSGDRVACSGLYVFEQHVCGSEEEVVLIAGDQFPSCPQCGATALLRLLRAAPSIYEDPDFMLR